MSDTAEEGRARTLHRKAGQCTRLAVLMVAVTTLLPSFPGLTQHLPEPVPAPDDKGAVTGEVPAAILDRMRADLAQRAGDGEEPALIRAENVVWPSGAMGCPKPGMNYIQVLVEGYHVVFARGDQRWDYRSNLGGGFILCEGAITLTVPPKQPAS